MSQTTVRRFDVREYTGTMDDVKDAIIKSDGNLIGLGLYDLGWYEFIEALEHRGYTRVDPEYSYGFDIRVQTWWPIAETEDAA